MPFWGRLIFCALGLIGISVGFGLLQQHMKARQWLTVKGKVLESAVTGFDEDFIQITYEYKVRGRAYVGDRFNVSRGSVGNASETIKQYQPGAIVDVLYNPQNPRESALTRDPIAIPIFFISVSVIFVLFGLFATF
jgi:hypothetical protein